MRRAPPIELSSEEFAALQRTVRSSRSSVREVFRARIVLLATEGVENLDIAEQLGTGPDNDPSYPANSTVFVRSSSDGVEGTTKRSPEWSGRTRKRRCPDDGITP